MRAGKRAVVLRDISLEMARGDFVGIFGPTGAGKTTLLRIAAGLEAPDSGVVTYQGRRLDQMSKAERRRYLRREVGCVWGARSLADGLDVLENVALPLLVDGCDHRQAERRAREKLMACGAEHCIAVDPRDLSDGERQRVSIARALVTEPRLVLADGPASNLGAIEQDSILALFQSLAREAKVAVLIADTDATAVLRSSPILYLRDGEFANADALDELGQVVELADARGRRPTGHA